MHTGMLKALLFYTKNELCLVVLVSDELIMFVYGDNIVSGT